MPPKYNRWWSIAEALNERAGDRTKWSSLWDRYKDYCPQKFGVIRSGTSMLLIMGTETNLVPVEEVISTEEIGVYSTVPWNEHYQYVIWQVGVDGEIGLMVANDDIYEKRDIP